MWKFIVLLVFYILNVSALKLQPFITPCHLNDPNINECALKSANIAIPYLVKGDPAYNLPVMNPMHIDTIKIPRLRNLQISIKNITVYGLKNTRVKDISIDTKAQNMTINIFNPRLEIITEYNMTGKLIVFPIEGQGPANITYVDGLYTYKMHYDLIKKKNKEYMFISDHSLTFVPKRGYLYFGNLFNGRNNVLANQILKFIDENWEEVNLDFGSVVAQAIDAISAYISNAILNKVPYEEVLLQD